MPQKREQLPGIPIKLLEESVGHNIFAELQKGIVVRGRLINVETCMNLVLEDVSMKDSGETRKLPKMMIRGNLILYIILPYMMKHSPLLQKVVEVANARKEHFKNR